MGNEAGDKHPLETGGVLSGYWADADQVVICSASGPGPLASHQRHRFCPDHDFQTEWIADRYHSGAGVETYLGDWHTHPGARTATPSWTDRTTLRRIARSAEARAPEPLAVILAGDGEGWSTFSWVGQLVPFLGFYDRLRMNACEVQIFND